jgi:hypothetical protein
MCRPQTALQHAPVDLCAYASIHSAPSCYPYCCHVTPRAPRRSQPAPPPCPCASAPGCPRSARSGWPAAAWCTRGESPPTAAGPAPKECRTPAHSHRIVKYNHTRRLTLTEHVPPAQLFELCDALAYTWQLQLAVTTVHGCHHLFLRLPLHRCPQCAMRRRPTCPAAAAPPARLSAAGGSRTRAPSDTVSDSHCSPHHSPTTATTQRPHGHRAERCYTQLSSLTHQRISQAGVSLIQRHCHVSALPPSQG